MTGSAQLMVLPILIQNFGNFSPISLISNVLVLELIPYTMMLGFAVAVLSGISHYLALIAGLVRLAAIESRDGTDRILRQLQSISKRVFGLDFYCCLLSGNRNFHFENVEKQGGVFKDTTLGIRARRWKNEGIHS